MLQLLTTPSERGIYMAGAILVYGTGVILGPVVGGSLADSSPSGWRWVCSIDDHDLNIHI